MDDRCFMVLVDDETPASPLPLGNELAPIAGEIVCDGPPPCHICGAPDTTRPCPTCRCVVCEMRPEDEEQDGLCTQCRDRRFADVHGAEARYER